MHNSKGGSPKILNYDCTNYFLYHQNAFEISPFFAVFGGNFGSLIRIRGSAFFFGIRIQESKILRIWI